MFDCVPEPVCQDIERKMLVEQAFDRLVGGTHDRVRLPLRQPAGRGID
jgi:hypothetical protein